jgi:LacI family transcriptional regulator
MKRWETTLYGFVSWKGAPFVPRWTTREVAKLAGVSPATVSRIVNAKANVAPSLVTKVRQTIRLLEQPEETAVPIKRVGVVFPRRIEAYDPGPIGGAFYGQVLAGVDEVLRQVGYDLSFVPFDPADDPEWQVSKQQDRLDGLILMGADSPDDLAREAVRQNLPVVVVDKQVRGVDSVVSDNIGGAEEVTEHVLRAGYRNLLYLCEALDDPSFAARKLGFERAIQNTQIPGLQVRCGEVGRGWLDAPRVLNTLMADLPGPIAVVAGNDMTALHILGLARVKGLSVPDQLGLAGFDDISLALRADPPLTTVRIDKIEMGRLAARRLVERMSIPDLLPITIMMHVELVVRGSTTLDITAPPK